LYKVDIVVQLVLFLDAVNCTGTDTYVQLDPYLYIKVRTQMMVACIDISQYRLLFGFSLLYTDRVPFELLDSAALL
jgi:hypothetical protein